MERSAKTKPEPGPTGRKTRLVAARSRLQNSQSSCCFPCMGGGITDLSVADNCLFGTAMEPVLPQTPMRGRSILTTIENSFSKKAPVWGH